MTDRTEHENNKDIKSLLRQFYNDAEARQFERNLLEVDRLFAQSPVPEPETQQIEDIKKRVAAKLASAGRVKMHFHFRIAAAAMLTIAVLLGFYFAGNNNRPADTAFTASSVDITNESWLEEQNETFNQLAYDIDILERSIHSINEQKLPDTSVLSSQTDNIENEIIEVSSTFWKG